MHQLLRSTGTRNHGRRLTHVVTKQCHPRLRPSVVYHSRCIEHDARPISFTKGLGLWTPQQRSFQSKSTKATSFACMTCGQEYRKWQGKCNACDAWDQIQSIEKISMDPGQAKKSTGHTRKQWIAAQHSGNTSIASTFAIPMHQIEVATAVTERIQLPENELVLLYVSSDDTQEYLILTFLYYTDEIELGVWGWNRSWLVDVINGKSRHWQKHRKSRQFHRSVRVL